MSERTTRTSVTFVRTFSLRGVEGENPAGTYLVETDEELILGMSFDAYRRTATFLYLPATSIAANATEVVNINPLDLQAALASDVAAAAAATEVVAVCHGTAAARA